MLARLRQLSAHEVGHTIGLGHNYYNSSKGRISVLDYPHPLITLKRDGTMDFSDVYTDGIGEWDKVAIRTATACSPRRPRRPTLQKSARRRVGRRSAVHDQSGSRTCIRTSISGTTARTSAAELTRMMNVRRAGLERFGETAIQKDRPMAMIEDVLVPLYLHHRYAVESAASALGGQDYIYAFRGDGRTPMRWVPAAAQKAALDALMSDAEAHRS